MVVGMCKSRGRVYLDQRDLIALFRKWFLDCSTGEQPDFKSVIERVEGIEVKEWKERT